MCMSSLSLNTLTDVASITSRGSPFHTLGVLTLRKYFLASRLNLGSLSFAPLERVLPSSVGENRSFWIRSTCSSVVATAPVLVLSAILISRLFTPSSMSLMKRLNRIGPRTDPWGTLLVTGRHPNDSPLMVTLCFQSVNHAIIHWTVLWCIPKRLSFSTRRSWGTLSKALLKSMSTIPENSQSAVLQNTKTFCSEGEVPVFSTGQQSCLTQLNVEMGMWNLEKTVIVVYKRPSQLLTAAPFSSRRTVPSQVLARLWGQGRREQETREVHAGQLSRLGEGREEGGNVCFPWAEGKGGERRGRRWPSQASPASPRCRGRKHGSCSTVAAACPEKAVAEAQELRPCSCSAFACPPPGLTRWLRLSPQPGDMAHIFVVLKKIAYGSEGINLITLNILGKFDSDCHAECCKKCSLSNGVHCSDGPCCNETCLFFPRGFECRYAVNECDITEICTGDSGQTATSFCPYPNCINHCFAASILWDRGPQTFSPGGQLKGVGAGCGPESWCGRGTWDAGEGVGVGRTLAEVGGRVHGHSKAQTGRQGGSAHAAMQRRAHDAAPCLLGDHFLLASPK
ncbi:Disintegrin and metalloproteinase domain-containing protein 23 [Varanus komodoensis]|nr:Disintegrin and metalloproteinase domain-containing protein 23 [Varanus komodoensis]